METDNKNVIYWSMGFTVLNLNTLVKTVKYDYIRNTIIMEVTQSKCGIKIAIRK